MRKLLAFLLCFIMTSTYIIGFNDYNVIASESKTYSVKVGKKLTLKTGLKNAIWGCDDTSIATVSSKGVVKGVAKGSCTIVAMANGKAELFTVKVTKSKKKNIVEIYNEYDGYYFKEPPIAYINGIKVTYYETTYADLMNGLKNTGYLVDCDIVAYDFTTEIREDYKRCATINFEVTDSMIAKDAVVTLVNIEKNKSGFYYFNSAFKPDKIPSFESFKNTSLFSQQIDWRFDEEYDYNDDTKIIVCERRIYYQIKEYEYYSYFIRFYFDSSSHKCLLVRMDNY